MLWSMLLAVLAVPVVGVAIAAPLWLLATRARFAYLVLVIAAVVVALLRTRRR